MYKNIMCGILSGRAVAKPGTQLQHAHNLRLLYHLELHINLDTQAKGVERALEK